MFNVLIWKSNKIYRFYTEVEYSDNSLLLKAVYSSGYGRDIFYKQTSSYTKEKIWAAFYYYIENFEPTTEIVVGRC